MPQPVSATTRRTHLARFLLLLLDAAAPVARRDGGGRGGDGFEAADEAGDDQRHAKPREEGAQDDGDALGEGEEEQVALDVRDVARDGDEIAVVQFEGLQTHGDVPVGGRGAFRVEAVFAAALADGAQDARLEAFGHRRGAQCSAVPRRKDDEGAVDVVFGGVDVHVLGELRRQAAEFVVFVL